MKKIILILILLLRGTHSIAGVGDVYNCKGFTEEAGMTFSGRNLEFNRYPPDDKFIFEWEESGISYIVDNPSSLTHGEKYLFKFKVSLVNDQGEFLSLITEQKRTIFQKKILPLFYIHLEMVA